MITRRSILKKLALGGLCGMSGFSGESLLTLGEKKMNRKSFTIQSVDTTFEREPLLRPFGFKGGYLTELWQVVSFLESVSGHKKAGLGTQSILWSDPDVFSSHSESGGNALMFSLTEYAQSLVAGKTFQDPVSLLEEIFEEVYDHGKRITWNPNLRETFILNALVSLDNAAWMLYAAENELKNFDDMIPEKYRAGLVQRQERIAAIPLISYDMPAQEIKSIAESGHFFLKIKLGHAGSQEEMLEKDKENISMIHQHLKDHYTAHTENGKLVYYFDANGRYEKKETLFQFIDHLEKIGAMEQVAIIEEPFPEDEPIDVHDIPIRIAADECAHTDRDVEERIQMGYGAVALKPIAKTLSMTLKMIKTAKESNIPCFCADLTVNPILVDWNKNVAARLDSLPGLDVGVLESNGPQNYKNWDRMASYHPYAGSDWQKIKGGMFKLSNEFYETSGGILTDSDHYMDMF